MQATERDQVVGATNAGLDDARKEIAAKDVEIEALNKRVVELKGERVLPATSRS